MNFAKVDRRRGATNREGILIQINTVLPFFTDGVKDIKLAEAFEICQQGEFLFQLEIAKF